MESMGSELLALEKLGAISREERPPDLPPIPPDNTVTPEDLEDLAGVGARSMGEANPTTLGPQPLAIAMLVIMGLGLLAQVLRLLGARARQKTQALAGAARAGAPRP